MQTQQNGDKSSGLIHVVRRGIVFLIFLGVIGAAIYFFQEVDHTPNPEEANAPAAPSEPTEVQVMAVRAESVSIVPRFLGQTEAFQTVEIRARVRGFLQEQGFREGTLVKKGDLLFKIDPRQFEADLEVARAGLAMAEAQLDRAQRQLRKHQELVAKNAGTPYELDEWQTQTAVAAADVQLQRARVAQAELDLSYTTIVSPITGMIGRALKDVGSYVDDSTNSLLATVQQVDPIYVRYSVSEQEMLEWNKRIEAGELTIENPEHIEVSLVLADGTRYPHRGFVDFVDVQIDPSTGTALVRAQFPNPEQKLRPGQFVHIEVEGIRRNQAVLVPQTAVMQSPAGAMVYVVSDNTSERVVEVRSVELGDWNGTRWIVESGLASGDLVILDQLQKLRPGMPVRPMSTATAQAH